jgi:hypothetical protein
MGGKASFAGAEMEMIEIGGNINLNFVNREREWQAISIRIEVLRNGRVKA